MSGLINILINIASGSEQISPKANIANEVRNIVSEANKHRERERANSAGSAGKHREQSEPYE
ncbi:MAG: hypothetical protein KDI38_06675 [Calditrichaeota bacterium]|nr:hypothetical protein [Calditrichota bacterium]MCB0311896.1 hypothetical protein [Calditrichota bacterium]